MKAADKPTIPPLSDADKKNYQTIQKAASEDNVALLSAIRKSDNKPVALICVVNWRDDRSADFVPLAVMVEGDPYEQYDCGFEGQEAIAEPPVEPAKSIKQWGVNKAMGCIKCKISKNVSVT